MPNFNILRRGITTVAGETDIGFIANDNGLFLLSKVSIISPSGCPYFLIRVYKSGILMYTFAPSSIAKKLNIISENVQLTSEKGSNLQITLTNLDPLGSSHDFEGSLT